LNDSVKASLLADGAALENHDAPDIVRWVRQRVGDDIVMSSSFGAESAAMIHLVTRMAPRIRIITVDTGFLFPETLEFMRELRDRFQLNLLIYRSAISPGDYLSSAGEDDASRRRDVARCCQVNKNEPFERALRELAPRAWLRGIRADQSDTRRHRSVVEWSDRHHCLAVSPILHWSTDRVHQYLKANGLPFHPLYSKGYCSIGCTPTTCTVSVGAGENARAGRWAGQQKTECGLHLETGPAT
jgi:phosphoadenosine phosphosulfate reductase